MGSSPVSQTFAAAILLAVIDDVTKNRIWVLADGREDQSGIEDAQEVSIDAEFEDFLRRVVCGDDWARRLACRKELIDSRASFAGSRL